MNIDILLAGFDASQIEQIGSIFWLAIGALVLSVAVGVYTFLQMRKMQKKNQPKPNQLDGTIADEGTSFCDIAGSPHVHANITDIWGKSTQAIKKKSGGFLGIGKTSQVTGYRYYAKFAAFTGNRIEKFLGINFDNRKWILHDPKYYGPNFLQIYEPNLFGENEGGVAGVIDIHTGLPEPEPNPTYQQYFPLVSGYPYQSYLVFRGFSDPIDGQAYAAPAKSSFYLGNSGYMKEMLLWVKRIHVKNDGGGQWHDDKAEIGLARFEDKTIELTQDYLDNAGSFVAQYRTNRRFSNNVEQNYTKSRAPSSVIGGSFAVGASEVYGINSNSGWPITSDGVMDAYFSSNYSNAFGFTIEIKSVGLTAIAQPFEQKSYFNIIDSWDIDEAGYGYFTKGYLVECFIYPSETLYLRISTKFPDDNSWSQGTHAIQLLTYWPKLGVIREASANGTDINPIHKIREILTDDTAMAKPETDVNDQNFVKAANRIWDEGLGVSWAIDEKSCIDAIEELCYHVEAGIRVNRQTGLYEMILFRDDWFSDDEIHDISESKIKDLSLEVMNSDDIVNQLNVTYYDRERIKNSTFSVYENGSILTMGHANAESVEFPYFMNMRNAEIVANWKLKQFSTPAWSGSFTTGWKEARKWNRYDLIRLPWSSKWNGTILVRIMKINLGNGADNTVTIDFEEVIPYSGEMSTSIVVDESMEVKPLPPMPSEDRAFEIPYYILVALFGEKAVLDELNFNDAVGWVGVVSRQMQYNSLYAAMLTHSGIEGEEWQESTNVEYVPYARIDQKSSRTATTLVIKNAEKFADIKPNTLINAGSEWMVFKSYTPSTNTIEVKRGVMDTIPVELFPDFPLYFSGTEISYDAENRVLGESILVSVLATTPGGRLPQLGSMTVSMNARAIRPYPPANVKINGEYWPAEIETDLVITWSDRNRLDLSVADWYSPSVAIEPNTQTHLIISQLDEDQIGVATSNMNVTGATSYTMPISSMQANTRFVKVALKTVRDGYECLQPFEYIVELSQFFSAPYDLTVEFKND